jgi:hypothetical protein
MVRYRVLTSSGAVYGDFSDYELALGQAKQLTSPRRRHKQSATVQIGESTGWGNVITFESGGALATIAAGVRALDPRRRPSALAEV